MSFIIRLNCLTTVPPWEPSPLVFLLVLISYLSCRTHWAQICSDITAPPTLLSYLDRTVRPRAQLTSGAGSAVTLQAMVRWVSFSLGWCSRLSSSTETTGASRQHSQSQLCVVIDIWNVWIQKNKISSETFKQIPA